MFEGFVSVTIRTDETTSFVRHAGNGPPVLLLHGFPQTHVMWRDIAPALAADFFVVCADLRGYGASGTPMSTTDHAAYAKRAMARDLVQVMAALGVERFAVAGHDRGGRVAYRLALDHPDRVECLALFDVVPTSEVFDRADARLALEFWPWSLLAQPAPLPETLISAAPAAIVDSALATWGAEATVVPDDVREHYVDALRSADHVHAICEEYRAAAGIDRSHDEADRRASRVMTCPVLALWAKGGSLTGGTKTPAGRSAFCAAGRLTSGATPLAAVTSSRSNGRRRRPPRSGRSCTTRSCEHTRAAARTSPIPACA